MAIEVEQKFLLTPEEEDRLLEDASFVTQENISDLYFEDSNYSLTTTDRWLRCRDGEWQLKLPQNWPRTSTVRQYIELETEAEIRDALKIPQQKDLLTDLRERGIQKFARISTIRQKYRKGDFNLDLDTANLTPDEPKQDFYRIAEIELMVQNEAARKAAVEDILQFARQHQLVARHIRGKLVEYIYRHRPEHFQVLLKAGVVVE